MLHTNFYTSLRRGEDLYSSDPRHAKRRVSLENPPKSAERNCLLVSIIMKDAYVLERGECITFTTAKR
jgi:hypothetical protein